MPASAEYQGFPIEAFTGGIRANVRLSAVPNGAFHDAFGWITKHQRAEFSAGYTIASPLVASEAWQDHWSGGVVSIASSRASELLSGGPPISVVRLVEIPDGEADKIAQLVRMVRAWGDWEFKLDSDPQAAWTRIDTALFVGRTFTLETLYPGRSFGPIGGVSGEVVRATIRRVLQAPAQQSARPNAGWGTARQATAPINFIFGYRPAAGVEHLIVATPREVFLYDGLARTLGRCLNPVSELDAATVTPPAGALPWLVGSAEFVTGYPAPRVGVDLIGLEIAPDLAEVVRIENAGATYSAGLRRPLEYDTGAFVPGTTKAIVRHGFNVEDPALALRHRWESAVWVDGLPEGLLVMTNGVNPVVKWNGGAGNLELLGGLVDIPDEGVTVSAALIVRAFYESLLLFGTIEDGVTHPRRFRWSRPRDCETWEAFKWRDLSTDDSIVQALRLKRAMVLFGDNSIHNVTPIGSPFDFKVEQRSDEIGCIAPGSVALVTIDQGGEGIMFLGPDDFYAYDGQNASRIGAPIRDLVLPLLSDESKGLIASHYWRDLGLYVCSVPTTARRGPGLHLADLRNAVTVAFDVQERAWQKPIEGFMGFGRWFQQTNLPIDAYTGPIDSYTDPFDARATLGRPVLLGGTWDGRLVQVFDGASAGGVDQQIYFETGASLLGADGLKLVGWVTPEGSGDAEIELWVRSSLDGNTGPLEFMGRFRMTDSAASGDELIIPVDRTGRFFQFRFVVNGRNANATLDSMGVYFRPLGRD